MDLKKKGYRKGTQALTGDLQRIVANVFWGVIIGGSAGGLASKSWRGVLIGAMTGSAFTVGILGGRATTQGAWLGTAIAVTSGVGAAVLAFSGPSAPATAGLGATAIESRASYTYNPRYATARMLRYPMRYARVSRLAAAPIMTYGHPMSQATMIVGGARG
jgi:hypothetical protein